MKDGHLLRKKFFIVLALALIARFFFFWLILEVKGEQGFLEGPDSNEYITIAQNILDHRTFSTDTTEHVQILGVDAPRPDNFRMPLYPLLLAGFFVLGAPISLAAVFQIFISAMTVGLVFLQGRKTFGERPAFFASLFLALHPYDAYFSSIIGNDPLFLVFSIPGIFFLLQFLQEQKKRHLFAGASLLGIATLVRTTGLFFLLLIPLLWFFVPNFHRGGRRALVQTASALGIAVLVLSPWIIRNKTVLDAWALSSDGQYALAYNSINHYYRSSLPREQNVFDNESSQNAFLRKLLGQDPNLRSYQNTAAIAREAGRALREYGVGYGFFHLRRAPVVFIDDGLPGLANAFGLPVTAVVSLRSALDSALGFDFSPLARYVQNIREHPFSAAGPLGISVRLGIATLALASIFVLPMGSPPRRIRLFLWMMFIGYAIALPLYGLHRHRMAIDPFLLGLAAMACTRLPFFRSHTPRIPITHVPSLTYNSSPTCCKLSLVQPTMNTTIIIPTYNEAENIEPLIREIFSRHPEISIAVVDDASPDKTAERVRALEAQYPRLELIERRNQRGFAGAYKTAFGHVLAREGLERVITMDADFSHHPKYIARLLEAAEKNHLVIGSRYVPGGAVQNWSLRRRLLSRWGNRYTRLITGMRIRDITTGFSCMQAQFLKSLPWQHTAAEGYAWLMEMKHLFHSAGAAIKEVPIVFEERRQGASKISKNIIMEGLIFPLELRFKRRLATPPRSA